jgi:hypothetical protein
LSQHGAEMACTLGIAQVNGRRHPHPVHHVPNVDLHFSQFGESLTRALIGIPHGRLVSTRPGDGNLQRCAGSYHMCVERDERRGWLGLGCAEPTWPANQRSKRGSHTCNSQALLWNVRGALVVIALIGALCDRIRFDEPVRLPLVPDDA